MGNYYNLGVRSGIQGATGIPLYFVHLPLEPIQNPCLHENIISASVFTTLAWILFFVLFLICPLVSFLPFCFSIFKYQFYYCADCRFKLE
ncbi:hypothetical protein SteCoe_35520 [Stentor coeruleus]|uniref:LITAF domain-containing protein n=1 Tax=Stentor coeruleus TaxID=5963 RepID=A0A1R2AS16_9CILI|nr:hypothetical protein SteCoe_35520 [Stentor coeruleus]